MNVRGAGRRLLHPLLIPSLSASLSHATYTLFHPPSPSFSLHFSPPHFTPISHCLPLSVLPKSHFLSYHLPRWRERLVLTVFIIPCLSSFDQEVSAQDLAAAAAAPNPARPIKDGHKYGVNIYVVFRLDLVSRSKLG